MRMIDADAFREELCKHFAGYGTHENDTKEDIEWNENLAWFIEQMDKAPTIETAGVVTAHYIPNGLFSTCSNCGNRTRIMKKYNIPNYCPACGAKMEATE